MHQDCHSNNRDFRKVTLLHFLPRHVHSQWGMWHGLWVAVFQMSSWIVTWRFCGRWNVLPFRAPPLRFLRSLW